MSTPFFLTRQAANLMEDFTRELKAGASIFLLYGDDGVGKTRLLRELSEKRLSDARIHWLDLSATDTGDESRQEGSVEVEAVFDAAQNGDIIIADHFELALKKTRHQLFLSWPTDGVDKKLNLIIASDTEGFNEFRQLSQQYQVRVQSFQQNPFNPEEIEAFLGFYLFPNHPIGKLSIPAALRKQLATTNGAVGPVIEIAARSGDQIKSSPMNDTESIRKGSRIIVTVLILIALTSGIGWYYLSRQYEMTETMPEVAVDQESQVTDEPVIEVDVVAVSEAESESEAVAELDSGDAELTTGELEAETEDVAETVTEATSEVESVVDTNAQTDVKHESGTASDTDAVLVEEVEVEEVNVEEAKVDEVKADEVKVPVLASTDRMEQSQAGQSDTARFQQDLQTSMDWIKGKDDSDGTVQILLLSFEKFDVTAYYEYVQSLANQQVDISNIRVFKTNTGNREVYSVFYGEYDTRRAALDALSELPEALIKVSPIPRSAGGIRTEIRRLEAVN